MLKITATDECMNTYNEMKLKHKIAYLVFHIAKEKNSKNQFIMIEHQAMKEDCGDDARDAFIAHVKESGTVRYGVIDHNNKLLFVSWVPDTAKPKDKMVYASVKEAFVESLVGVQHKIQCTDDAELSKEAIAEKTQSKV